MLSKPRATAAALGSPDHGRPPSILEKCSAFTLPDTLKAGGNYPYHRVIETGQGTEVTVGGRRMLMLGSNSYLELTSHPRVKERAREAIRRYGTGCAGSRFLNGTLPIHVELERRLAALVGKEAALVFPTGFQTNTGVISSLVQKGEFVLGDKLIHACIMDGCLLSQGTLVRYEHNSMADLEKRLARLPPSAPRLIVTDGVFSMEGDLCDLPGIAALADRYGAQIMVDDAHGLGVLGPGGSGTAAHFGLTGQVDLIMGTFSKSLAAIGGFIAGTERTINYLMHTARPYMFSASASPASVAAALAALEVMAAEPERLDQLRGNAAFLRQGLLELGFETGAGDRTLAGGTPIIPILTGSFQVCMAMWKRLQHEGIFVNPVVPPAVPPGRCLIRTSVTAGHTRAQLSWALEAFRRAGRHLGLLERGA